MFRVLSSSILLSSFSTLSGATFLTNINFNEAAFPTSTQAVSGVSGYNVLDDATGTELVALNGDLDDIFITASGDIEYQTASQGRFTGSHSFSTPAAVNNPGTRMENVIELTFGNHLTVTDFSFDVASANSRGITWEYTVFELLNENGLVISPGTSVAPYLSHTMINGSPAPGVYVLDWKDTVQNVGSAMTMVGTSNPNDNFSVTGDLNYADFGIAPGTQIGGLRMTTVLEDTRGVNNASGSQLTSSLIDFTFSGEIAVPEPSVGAIVLIASLSLFKRKRSV